LKATRVGPVKVQKLYVVPYFNKLNVFGVVDQRPMSIQPSFVSEPYVISCCCFSPDGSFLATCANGAPLFVLIWDTKLCTVVQVLPFLMMRAVGCWWSESLLWIYDGGLVKIPISNGQILNPSSARREKINWKPTKLLTFSDVLVFIDQENSANVARIKDGELQYVEKLPVDKSIICAAISPCNSIILAASSETFHVWKEDQTLQPLHWVASNTGELLDILRKKDGEGDNSHPSVGQKVCCKCCITNDGATGLLALSFGEYSCCIILVDLNSEIMTLPKVIRSPTQVVNRDVFYAGNSYCIGLKQLGVDLVAEKLADGEVVAEWKKSLRFDLSSTIVALSKNDLVAIIAGSGAIIQFLKVVVPE
jgi:WD40 repeat protein